MTNLDGHARLQDVIEHITTLASREIPAPSCSFTTETAVSSDSMSPNVAWTPVRPRHRLAGEDTG